MAKGRRTTDTDQTASATGESAAMPEPRPQGEERGNEQQPDRIAARAYELYLARGGGHGQDWDDWLAAERELASAATPRRDRSE